MNSGKILNISNSPEQIDLEGLFGSSESILTAKGTLYYCETDEAHTFKARAVTGLIPVNNFQWDIEGSSFTVSQNGSSTPYTTMDLRVGEHIPLSNTGVLLGFGIVRSVGNDVRVDIAHAIGDITTINNIEIYQDSVLESEEQIEIPPDVKYISLISDTSAMAVFHTGSLKKKSNSGVGSGGSGGGSTYTNATPTPTTIGGIDAGSTFLNQTMQQMWDALLYPYQYPAFTAFSISGGNIFEVGESLSSHLNVTWSTSNSSNVQANSIDLDDITDSTNIFTNGADDGSEAIVISTITHNAPATHTWKLTGTNTKGNNFTRNHSKYWYFRLYYGNENTTPLDENGIEGLSDSLLTNTFVRTYHYASGGGYKYVCYPESFGTATNFTDVDTGFAVAMESPYTVSVTNSLGVTTNYRVHRTTNVINGALNMSVS